MPGHSLAFTRTYTRRWRFRKCKWACAFLADWLRLLYFSHTPSVNQKALPCKVAQNNISANHMLRVHARRSRSMSARAHPAKHLSIAKTQTRTLNKCAKGGRSAPSRESSRQAQTSWLIHMNILPHKHGSESKSVSLSFSLQHALVSVCVCVWWGVDWS